MLGSHEQIHRSAQILSLFHETAASNNKQTTIHHASTDQPASHVSGFDSRRLWSDLLHSGECQDQTGDACELEKHAVDDVVRLATRDAPDSLRTRQNFRSIDDLFDASLDDDVSNGLGIASMDVEDRQSSCKVACCCQYCGLG